MIEQEIIDLYNKEKEIFERAVANKQALGDFISLEDFISVYGYGIEDEITDIEKTENGGPNSGFHGHVGIPGQRGGGAHSSDIKEFDYDWDKGDLKTGLPDINYNIKKEDNGGTGSGWWNPDHAMRVSAMFHSPAMRRAIKTAKSISAVYALCNAQSAYPTSRKARFPKTDTARDVLAENAKNGIKSELKKTPVRDTIKDLTGLRPKISKEKLKHDDEDFQKIAELSITLGDAAFDGKSGFGIGYLKNRLKETAERVRVSIKQDKTTKQESWVVYKNSQGKKVGEDEVSNIKENLLKQLEKAMDELEGPERRKFTALPDAKQSIAKNGGTGSGWFNPDHAARMKDDSTGKTEKQKSSDVRQNFKKLQEITNWNKYELNNVMPYFGSFENTAKVQDYLRGGDDKPISNTAMASDCARSMKEKMERTRLPEDTTLYRGMMIRNDRLERCEQNGFSASGFQSTSMIGNDASKIIQEYKDSDNYDSKYYTPVLLKINAKKGSRFAASYTDGEHEIVLPDNIKFKINNKKETSLGKMYEVDYEE